MFSPLAEQEEYGKAETNFGPNPRKTRPTKGPEHERTNDDRLEAFPAGPQGGRGAIAVHRHPGGRRFVHRLLGHGGELLEQVDAAAGGRGPRVAGGPGVLLPDASQRGAEHLRAERGRAQVSDLRHAAFHPREGGKRGAAARRDGPRPAHARANPTGRGQDDPGGASAGDAAGDDGGLRVVRREPADPRGRPGIGLRRETLREQDIFRRS